MTFWEGGGWRHDSHPTVKASWLHSHMPHSIGFLWTSDQPDAEISTWHQTTITQDRQLCCPQQDLYLQSQPANGCRPTPKTAWMLELAVCYNSLLLYNVDMLKQSHGICCRLYFSITIYNIFMCKITITNQKILSIFSPVFTCICYLCTNLLCPPFLCEALVGWELLQWWSYACLLIEQSALVKCSWPMRSINIS
jgi:hypothetical protein